MAEISVSEKENASLFFRPYYTTSFYKNPHKNISTEHDLHGIIFMVSPETTACHQAKAPCHISRKGLIL
jgi:hypothetical protein